MGASYLVYIIYSAKLDRFYIGESYEIKQRLDYHNSMELNTNSTRVGIPWVIYFTIPVENRNQARKIESHIKRMKSKTYFKNLKKYPEMTKKLLKRYAI